VLAVIYYIFQTVFHKKTDGVQSCPPQSLPPSQAARSSKRCAATDNNYHLSKHFVFNAPTTGSQASSLRAKAFVLHSFLPFFLFPAALSSIIIVLCGAPSCFQIWSLMRKRLDGVLYSCLARAASQGRSFDRALLSGQFLE